MKIALFVLLTLSAILLSILGGIRAGTSHDRAIGRDPELGQELERDSEDKTY